MPESSRPPLDAGLLRDALAAQDAVWRDVHVVGTTGSTNRDAADLAQQGAPSGTAVLADAQTQGRGRLQRGWVSPPGASLSMSVVLRPSAPTQTWGWLPLLAGVAVLEGVRDVLAGAADGIALGLKWPNDLVVDGADRGGGPGPRKWGGILAERVDVLPADAAVVVGIGLNVGGGADELPTPTATSLALEAPGAATSREALAAAVLCRGASWFERWDGTHGHAERCGLLTAYRASCLTLGREVRVELPGSTQLGLATDVDGAGRLLVSSADGQRVYSSGDVVHLRTR